MCDDSGELVAAVAEQFVGAWLVLVRVRSHVRSMLLRGRLRGPLLGLGLGLGLVHVSWRGYAGG